MKKTIGKKVVCYVDGYNLYHTVKDNPSAKIDLKSLAQSILLDGQSLIKVYYFSAYATWRKRDHKKHLAYVAKLRKAGVAVTMSHFKDTKKNVVPAGLSGHNTKKRKRMCASHCKSLRML